MTQNNQITYKNVKVNNVRFSGNNFSIFVGLVDGNKEIFTGNILVSKGEKLNIVGEKVVNPKYGEQVKIISYERNDELDLKDLKEYLKSFKGIGEAKAKKIVDTFGESAIEIIKTDYIQLIPLGINLSTAKEMHDSLCKNKVLNELIQLIGPYGVSLNTINKIYDKYKDKSIEMLKFNPYKLKDYFNMSFDVLDNFSLKTGLKTNSLSRIIGGIKESMSFYVSLGHTFAYVSDIVEKTKIRLNKRITNEDKLVTNADIIKALIYLSEEENELIIGNDSSVYFPHFYYAERNISRKILRINKACNNTQLVKPFEEIIEDVQKSINIEYSSNQQQAIKTSLINPISIITGGPGTGKTTTVNGYIHALKKNDPDIKILLAAPTGKAAKRMEESTGMKATTIHRLLEYKVFGGELSCGRNEENPIEADVIIIDESSMIDVSLMDKFLKAVDSETKLTFVGDVDQLPSVGPGNVLKDLISCNVIPVTKLDTIFRQKGTSTIVTNAYNINEGLGINLDNDDFVMVEMNEEDVEVSKAIVAEYISLLNQNYSIDDIQVLCPMRKKENLCSSTVINKMIQDAINPKKDNRMELSFNGTTYREGDKVIQLKNNNEKNCFNGDVGYIISISRNNGEGNMVVKFDNDLEVTFYGREEILELDLAYAMSVHKSQGSEYPTVLIPMVDSQKVMHTRNLFYTAVTRAKKNVKLFGNMQSVNRAISNIDNTKRNSKLCNYIAETTVKFN